MPNFSSKTVLVTGASSGIGAATAVKFAESKCSRLVITGRNQQNLLRTQAECVKVGLLIENCLLVAADLTTETDRKKLLDTIKEKFGSLDVLVNNAGICPRLRGRVSDLDNLDVYDSIMDTNVRATIAVTQSMLPMLIQAKGSIVNVSSVAGTRPAHYVTYYAMSKACIDQFTKCLALELASHGVRVNAVNPAVIRTPIFETGGLTETETDDFYKRMADCHPLGRIGEAEEVANAITFLASSLASFTTAETLLIDGGRAAVMPK